MKLQKTILVILIALCLPTPALAAVDWAVEKTIDTKVAIKDMAISFDGKSFFVLSQTGFLTMYDDTGKAQGSMQVDKSMDKIFLSGFQKAGVPEQIFAVNSGTGQMQQLSFSLVAQIDIKGSPFLGNPEAPVALVVFSDFQ